MRTIKLTRDEYRSWRENADGAREKLKELLLIRTEGETLRLMAPSARFMGTIKGTSGGPVSGAPTGVQNGAPSPESCVCIGYAGTVPGKHHQVCQHRVAWESSRGVVTQIVKDTNNVVTHANVGAQISRGAATHFEVPKQIPNPQVQHFNLPTRNPRGRATPGVAVPHIVPTVVALIPPNLCDCAKFTKPSDADPNQHHFVCQNYEKWKTAHPTVIATAAAAAPVAELEEASAHHDTEPPPTYVLTDLETRVVMREATSDEVIEAHAAEEATGSPIITVDDASYAVLPIAQTAAMSVAATT